MQVPSEVTMAVPRWLLEGGLAGFIIACVAFLLFIVGKFIIPNIRKSNPGSSKHSSPAVYPSHIGKDDLSRFESKQDKSLDIATQQSQILSNQTIILQGMQRSLENLVERR